MTNLQLIDSLEGGYFIFRRNDYPIDEGIYTELYICLFGTDSSEWLGDNAFGVQSEKVSSRTEITLRTNNSNSQNDVSLIKKAVNDDLERLTKKNPAIKIESVSVIASVRAVEINIQISGYDEDFNFIFQKTSESLINIT